MAQRYPVRRGSPRESRVRWDLVRENDSYEACEIRIDESEALSFAGYADAVRGGIAQ